MYEGRWGGGAFGFHGNRRTPALVTHFYRALGKAPIRIFTYTEPLREANRGPERDDDGDEFRREHVGELRREHRDQLRAVLLPRTPRKPPRP